MNTIREPAARFGFALFVVAVATYLRVLLTPLIQDRLPYGTYTVAVIFVAWISGVWPAVLALITSTICAAHFVIPPAESLGIDSPADLLALCIFFTVGTISIILFARIENERQSAVRQSRENESLNAELRERDRQKDEFLALLAHELRSPLAPIGNSIALLQKEDGLFESTQNIAQRLSKNFSHLVRLTNDLLDVSRYLRDTIELKIETTDLADCVQSAVEMARHELTEKQHELILEPPSPPVVAQVDPVRMCQIVCNLLSNAIKYTPDRGRIILHWAGDANGLRLEIRDNGLGIPDSVRERIFTPFFQANSKQSRYAPGLGLGLSIVKKLVELHGGTIEVESGGQDRGSRFIVHFPGKLLEPSRRCQEQTTVPGPPFDPSVAMASAMRDSTAHRQLRGESQSAKNRQPEMSNKALEHRVLIVDDDADTADSLSRLLTLEGYVTKEANNGIEAFNTFHSFQPSAVILDIGLPEMNGFEVARKLRQTCVHHPFRIIAVSGWGSEADLEKGKLAGFDEHLVKPVEFQRLLELLPR